MNFCLVELGRAPDKTSVESRLDLQPLRAFVFMIMLGHRKLREIHQLCFARVKEVVYRYPSGRQRKNVCVVSEQ